MLMMQLKIMSCLVAVRIVIARNMGRLLKSFAPTLNVRKYLMNPNQIAYRYMMIWSNAAPPLKYAVIDHIFNSFCCRTHACFLFFMCVMCIYPKIDKEKLRSLSTCEVDGLTYHIGERIYPEKSGHECLCVDGFNNATSYADNPNCAKYNCGIQLEMNSLRGGCVPVYFKSPNHCPIEYKCREFWS